MTTIIAHRGASHDKPENTLAAIAEAWFQDADGVEVDIRQSRDGYPVLFHDEDTARRGGREQPVAEQTIDQLKQLDVGELEKIPTLHEGLRHAPHDHDWLLDIKTDGSIIDAVREAITRSRFPQERVIIASGKDDVLTRAKEALPECHTLVLGSLNASNDIDAVLEQAKRVGADGVDLEANEHLDEAAAKRVVDAGLALCVWTVNDVDTARRMRSLGADTITTDKPGELRRLLRSD